MKSFGMKTFDTCHPEPSQLLPGSTVRPLPNRQGNGNGPGKHLAQQPNLENEGLLLPRPLKKHGMTEEEEEAEEEAEKAGEEGGGSSEAGWHEEGGLPHTP